MEEFVQWLESDLTNFVSLIEEGSTVTGDPWQEGFSDYDITIVVSHDEDSEMEAVYKWLSQNPFPDLYLFGPRLAHEFVEGNSINDISLKFRSRTIAGKDLIADKQAPNRDQAQILGISGLKNLEIRCKRRHLNLAHWSTEHCQKANYSIFKDFFVLTAAKLYGETGNYPTKREDVVTAMSQTTDLVPILKVTNDIRNASKSEQKVAFETALDFIQTLHE